MYIGGSNPRNPGTDHAFCLPCSAGGQGDLPPILSAHVSPKGNKYAGYLIQPELSILHTYFPIITAAACVAGLILFRPAARPMAGLLASLLRGAVATLNIASKSPAAMAQTAGRFIIYGGLNSMFDAVFQQVLSGKVDCKRVTFSFFLGGVLGVAGANTKWLHEAQRLRLTAVKNLGTCTSYVSPDFLNSLTTAMNLGAIEGAVMGGIDGAIWNSTDPNVKGFDGWLASTIIAVGMGAAMGAILGPAFDYAGIALKKWGQSMGTGYYENLSCPLRECPDGPPIFLSQADDTTRGGGRKSSSTLTVGPNTPGFLTGEVLTLAAEGRGTIKKSIRVTEDDADLIKDIVITALKRIRDEKGLAHTELTGLAYIIVWRDAGHRLRYYEMSVFRGSADAPFAFTYTKEPQFFSPRPGAVTERPVPEQHKALTFEEPPEGVGIEIDSPASEGAAHPATAVHPSFPTPERPHIIDSITVGELQAAAREAGEPHTAEMIGRLCGPSGQTVRASFHVDGRDLVINVGQTRFHVRGQAAEKWLRMLGYAIPEPPPTAPPPRVTQTAMDAGVDPESIAMAPDVVLETASGRVDMGTMSGRMVIPPEAPQPRQRLRSIELPVGDDGLPTLEPEALEPIEVVPEAIDVEFSAPTAEKPTGSRTPSQDRIAQWVDAEIAAHDSGETPAAPSPPPDYIEVPVVREPFVVEHHSGERPAVTPSRSIPPSARSAAGVRPGHYNASLRTEAVEAKLRSLADANGLNPAEMLSELRNVRGSSAMASELAVAEDGRATLIMADRRIRIPSEILLDFLIWVQEQT